MPVYCPQCRTTGEVHVSLYNRPLVPTGEHRDEDKWRKTKLNTDGTVIVAAEKAVCRVCWGKGSL